MRRALAKLDPPLVIHHFSPAIEAPQYPYTAFLYFN